MIFIVIALFYLFGGVFMLLKVMKDLKNEENMPEFLIFGAAFAVFLYPLTYPILKLMDVLESRKHYKEISKETARL